MARCIAWAPCPVQAPPKTKRFLKNAKDFDRAADGGCDLPCVVKLKVGHMCPRKCHPGDGHMRVVCAVQHKFNFSQGHILDYFCGNGPKPCKMCAKYECRLRQAKRCNGKKNAIAKMPMKLRILQ